MPRVLMVISAADTLTLADGTAHPTGYWAEEVAASHERLVQAGAEVVLASPGGRFTTVDPISLDERGGVDPAEGKRFAAYLAGLADELRAPVALADVDLAAYDAVYLPGGHAPMTDLTDDADLGRLLVQADAAANPVAALCHGVAGLLSAATADSWIYAGRRVAGFTDAEEQAGGYGDQIPFSVEQKLRESGAEFVEGEPWSDTVVVDGTLITGQNPQSSISTADALLEALKA